MAGKTKICARGPTSWGRGSGVRDMALLLLGNLRAKFSETSFPPFKTYLPKSAIFILRQQFKMFNIIGDELFLNFGAKFRR